MFGSSVVPDFELTRKYASPGDSARSTARIWAPRWVGPLLYLRGVLQPLTERVASKDTTDLVEAIRLAQESNTADGAGSPLGVAAKALD